MAGWYARALLHVADVQRALDFYAGGLGFVEAWRHEDEGRLLVVQVDREGCELILTAQWPDRCGRGTIFVSLDAGAFAAAGAEFAQGGIAVKEDWWGYRLMIVEDPDGNQLFFPHPREG